MITTDDRVTRVLRARQAGGVQRCHTTPHHGDYKIAEHTAQMLLLLDVLNPKATIRLWRAVLHHDLHEYYTGDLPGSVGAVDPELKAVFRSAGDIVSEHLGWAPEGLTEGELRWLHAVDKLELWLWCHDELNMGNDHVAAIVNSLDEWFEKNKAELPYTVRTFMNGFEWRKIGNAEL